MPYIRFNKSIEKEIFYENLRAFRSNQDKITKHLILDEYHKRFINDHRDYVKIHREMRVKSKN